MIKGYFQKEASKIGLGTHLGSFSDEDSRQYADAIAFALTNGINAIDTAINYRGMRSEKDVGSAIGDLISLGKLKREDICISTKAGLLFGDITTDLNPQRYLQEILEPKGITIRDFAEFEGLYQTLNPAFFETALEKSLQNLNVETIDVHYVHIPEITRSVLSEDEFYLEIRKLFEWYEAKIKEGKLRCYGLALEFMIEEPGEAKWFFSIEKICHIADEVSHGDRHFQYIQLPYNMLCPYAATFRNQPYNGELTTMIDVCRKLGLHMIGSMPFAMEDGFECSSARQLLDFALDGMDTVNIGSRNIDHIREALSL